MTPRKAATLATQLPPGAATWASCGLDSAWSVEAHRMADLFDVLQLANWQRAAGNDASKPTPMRRPGDVAEEASKRDRMVARARAAHERQQQQQQDTTPPPRARDARGRFV